jgi:GxxExxY protein
MTLTRTAATLPEELELLVSQTIGACLAVHRELGPGMNEGVYSRALALELASRGLAFETEKPLPVRYRGRLLCHQRVDLLVEGQLVIEVKSVGALHAVHIAQAISYLRLTRTRVALVVNFNVSVLKQEFGESCCESVFVPS